MSRLEYVDFLSCWKKALLFLQRSFNPFSFCRYDRKNIDMHVNNSEKAKSSSQTLSNKKERRENHTPDKYDAFTEIYLAYSESLTLS